MSLPSWASNFQEGILAFTWRQWSQLGVAGVRQRPDGWCQDPEALLVFSLEVSRQEPRAFDEILDWLARNPQALMIHRIKHLLANDPDLPRNVVEAALERAGVVKRGSTSDEATEATSLFPMFDTSHGMSRAWDPVFLRHGLQRPAFQASGKTQALRVSVPVAFAFKLRAVFGASARAEALRYLLLNPGSKAGTAQIAEAALLTRFGVQQALEELHQAGLIQRGVRGKKDLAWWIEPVHPLSWLLPGTGEVPGWVNWPSVYRGLAIVWRWATDPRRGQEGPYILASGARAAMSQALPFLSDQGLAWRAEPSEGVLGAAYLDVFTRDLQALVRALNEPAVSTQVHYESLVDVVAHRHFAISRTVESEDGYLARGDMKGRARDLMIHWNAFDEVTASVRLLDASPSLLGGLMGGIAGRLPDHPELGCYEGRQDDGRTVTLDEVRIDGVHVSMEERTRFANVRLGFQKASITQDPPARARYLRFLLGNLDLDLWPQTSMDSNGTWTRDALSFHFQSHTVHLTDLRKDPAVAALVLEGDFRLGEPLGFAHQVATLFSFLVDAPVEVVAMEAYDADAKPISEALFPAGIPAARPRRAPIRWSTTMDGNLVLASRMPAVVSTLMERFMALKEPFDLPAVVGSLGAVRGGPIEIETLVKLVAIRKMARAWAAHAGREHSGDDVWQLIEALQVPLEASAKEVLAAQLLAAEDGSLLSTTPDGAARQGKVEALGLVTTVSNACLLRLLGYEGPMVDYGRFGYPNIELPPSMAR